jgi:uncharacterized protein with ATP-grasp and redox domains
MKAKKRCLSCIANLTRQTLSLCFGQGKLTDKEKTRISKEVLSLLKTRFSTDKAPAAVFTQINRRIKKLTKIDDAFTKRKSLEIKSAREISRKIFKNPFAGLERLLLFSAKGNSLDFFKTIEQSEKDMQKKSFFAINQIKQFRAHLKKAKQIAFFADNSGEMFFDRPLINYLGKEHKVYYIVKSFPVQNDLTIKEIKTSKDIKLKATVIACGNDAVGIEKQSLSKKAGKILNNADIIIAKGMGYYETFTELPEYKHKTYHLLMAKCLPVAQSLKVPLHSYVFTKA